MRGSGAGRHDRAGPVTALRDVWAPLIVKALRKSLDGACEEHRAELRALLDRDLAMVPLAERDRIWQEATR